jgi:poly-D-alanine transfer protein DltD
MFKDILKSIQETSEMVMEKATELNETAKEKIKEAKDQTKEKAFGIIEEWVEMVPQLTQMGLELTSFGVSMSISPRLLIELKGDPKLFTKERIANLALKHEEDRSIKLFLKVLDSSLSLHQKTKQNLPEDMYVRIEVKLSPEINVFIGKPLMA